jgi:hypothetical protein
MFLLRLPVAWERYRAQTKWRAVVALVVMTAAL